MGELRDALEDARSGRGRLVMLVGEPGIGKTRTAQELAAHAETVRAQVLWGRCYEEEGAPPYWPWLQSLLPYIQQQSPEQLQAEVGPGAADIGDILSEMREKLPKLESPPPLEPEQARFHLHPHFFEERRPVPTLDAGPGRPALGGPVFTAFAGVSGPRDPIQSPIGIGNLPGCGGVMTPSFVRNSGESDSGATLSESTATGAGGA